VSSLSNTLATASSLEVQAPTSLQVIVKGLPAPQGSKSFKGMSRSGHAILVEASAKVRPWRQDVVYAAEQAIEHSPGFKTFQGPIHLVIEFYMPRPKSAPKTRRTVPDKTPDLSKLIRSTEDALTTAAVWRDDAQVVDLTVRKRYATFGDEAIGHPWELPGSGAVITVVELDAENTWSDMPLAEQSATRFPAAELPEALKNAPTTTDWDGESVTIPATMSDAQARKLVQKLLTQSERRVAANAKGTAPSHAIALLVEDGAHRLAAHRGAPISELAAEIATIAEQSAEHQTEIVVIFTKTVN
jgi:Holliday junction resolvase RusA-like endonuclease